MNRLTPLLLLLAASCLAAAEKPNFILIFADDLGYGDLGAFGSERHRTPNLDRMAAEGRKFTSFYVSANVCTPSRASLLTGSYPRRVGLHENEREQWVLFPGNQTGLHADEVTLPEILREVGYRTAGVGKRRLGDQPQFLPTRHGFHSAFSRPSGRPQAPFQPSHKNSRPPPNSTVRWSVSRPPLHPELV